MAARRMFNEDVSEPPMLFENSGQPDQQYAGNLSLPQGPTKRKLSSQDEPEMPMQRYIPPATMEILLAEASRRR